MTISEAQAILRRADAMLECVELERGESEYRCRVYVGRRPGDSSVPRGAPIFRGRTWDAVIGIALAAGHLLARDLLTLVPASEPEPEPRRLLLVIDHPITFDQRIEFAIDPVSAEQLARDFPRSCRRAYAPAGGRQ